MRAGRVFGASEIRHVGKSAIRESDAVHARVLGVRLNCNEGIRVVPVIEEQPPVGITPLQAVKTDNGSWFLRGRVGAASAASLGIGHRFSPAPTWRGCLSVFAKRGLHT